jgi:hypothetical protein
MNKFLLEKLMQWPKSFISGTDLHIILGKNSDAYYSTIKCAVKENYLFRLRKDLYLIKSTFHKELPDTFEIAQLVYGPSYISFESALSEYQWIPEGVPTTTSACVKRGKKFKGTLGLFTYEHVPIDIFPLGIHSIRTQHSVYMLAEPWKAVADIIYSRKKNWPDLSSFSEDMRVESESLKESNFETLLILSEIYPSQRTRKILNKFYQDLKCL